MAWTRVLFGRMRGGERARQVPVTMKHLVWERKYQAMMIGNSSSAQLPSGNWTGFL